VSATARTLASSWLRLLGTTKHVWFKTARYGPPHAAALIPIDGDDEGAAGTSKAFANAGLMFGDVVVDHATVHGDQELLSEPSGLSCSSETRTSSSALSSLLLAPPIRAWPRQRHPSAAEYTRFARLLLVPMDRNVVDDDVAPHQHSVHERLRRGDDTFVVFIDRRRAGCVGRAGGGVIGP
jgi:hypothetical protein